MLDSVKVALVLAPHTDDGEFGCGATIRKMLNKGIEVHYVAFSACEKSVSDGFPPDILVTEMRKATAALGLIPDNVHLLNYEVRTFNFQRQSILDDLIGLREQINPDLILMPSMNDVHQDHATIAEEGLRAFKFSNILAYEMPWNNFSFSTACFSILTHSDMHAKMDAIKNYKSQAHRAYANEDFILGLGKVRGVQVNAEYAEAFEVIRFKI